MPATPQHNGRYVACTRNLRPKRPACRRNDTRCTQFEATSSEYPTRPACTKPPLDSFWQDRLGRWDCRRQLTGTMNRSQNLDFPAFRQRLRSKVRHGVRGALANAVGDDLISIVFTSFVRHPSWGRQSTRRRNPGRIFTPVRILVSTLHSGCDRLGPTMKIKTGRECLHMSKRAQCFRRCRRPISEGVVRESGSKQGG